MWEVLDHGPLVWRFIALPAGSNADYVWHWLCEDERGTVHAGSARGFSYYFECLEDARRCGYGGSPQPGPLTRQREGDLIGSRSSR